MAKIRKAVIPAAGLGSRMYPLTRAQPKEMLPILDKPVIHHVVDEILSAGIDQILVIVGKGKESIINYFDYNELDLKFNSMPDFPEIFFVRQREQKGLADAVKYAKKFVNDEPFMVLAGDTIYGSNKEKTIAQQIIDVFNRKSSTVIGLEKVPIEKVKHYGIVNGDEIEKGLHLIKNMVEKPEISEAPSNLAITAAYALQPDIFAFIDKIKPGKNNEYQLTDALNLMCKEQDVFGIEIDGKRYDIGSKEFWVETFIEFARKDERFSYIFKNPDNL
ncbi:MAG: Nucleotidyl transferase [Candidatus Parvarchaeum acidiphilum ARMAN-4]|jgi:UTP--glucose-1-phosphate uridylyltransferase|uniref:UTP--glucose-1-phosphate uridylyltransferase n=1 Tax=Candidatus Parvarchaeum acidiphilum ARMAN-4 TaxID=662760 RepID=D2EEQ5_PARA4|nr:MAG: Nucleotidyl transferase [Candidatus Parvarchaeum acidiphilum ARMAN-4]